MANSMIGWGVRFAATSYTLKVTADSVAATLNFPAAGALAGDYYMTGDAQADDLLTILKTTLETHSGIATATVGFDADFRITVSAVKPASGAAVLSLEWDDAATTLDKAVFGYAASTSLAATTLVGAHQASGLWRAGRALADDSRDRTPISGGVARSISGLSYVARIATSVAPERSVSWSLVPQERILTEYATSPRASFEYGWLYSMSYGYALRLYADETSRTSSSYDLYTVGGLGDPLSRSEIYSVRWDVALELVKRLGA